MLVVGPPNEGVALTVKLVEMLRREYHLMYSQLAPTLSTATLSGMGGRAVVNTCMIS